MSPSNKGKSSSLFGKFRRSHRQDSKHVATTAESSKSTQSTTTFAQSISSINLMTAEESLQERGSLWNQAYDALKAKGGPKVKNLVEKYEALVQEDFQVMTSTTQGCSIFDQTSRRTQLENELKKGKTKHDAKGKIVTRGHMIDIQDYIVKIAGGLGFVKDLVGQAVAASPEASIAWSVVCLGLQLFTKAAGVEETNSDGLAYVSSRIQLYIALEGLLFPADVLPASTAAREEIRLQLIELYKNILDFQIRSIVRFRKGRWYEDTYGKDDWEVMRSRIQALESNIRNDSLLVSNNESSLQLQILLKNANAAQIEMVDLNRQQLKHLQSIDGNANRQTVLQTQRLQLAQEEEVSRQEEKERKCMEALLLDQRYDETKNLIPPRVENTCRWFLEQSDYKNWLSNSGNCILVTADPGCGKSVLAKHILEHELPHSDQTGRPICYFFFKDQIQNTFAMALSALLHQLLQKTEDMFKYLMPLYQSNGVKMTGNSLGLSEALLKMLSDSKIQPVTFVLDALDECKGDDVEKMLDWIAEINRSRGSMVKHKLLLTSRPYQDIITKFGRMKGSSYIHIPGNDKSKEISQEVNLVIEHRCQELYDNKRINRSARDKLLSKLLAQPHNTYLFVYLVFKELERQGLYNQTEKELDRRLRELPESVDQAYENILNRYTKDDEISRKSVVRLLSIMLAANRPLKVEEIQCAIKCDFEDSNLLHKDLDLENTFDFGNKLRDWCGLFVQIDAEDQVTFLHQTAREFLLPKSGQNIGIVQASRTWAHSITLIEAHALLATICIAYLSLKDFDQPVELYSSHKDRDDEFDERMQRWAWANKMPERYSFLEYAAGQWNYHFIEGQCEQSPGVLKNASALYDDNIGYFSTWIEVATVFTSQYRHHFSGSFRRPRPLTVAAFVSPSILRGLISTTGFHLDIPLGEAALVSAIEGGHEESAFLLLEHGVNPNCRDSYSRTVLSRCVDKNLKSLATYLLKHGADINSQTEYGSTALHEAAAQNHPNFAQILLEKHAKVDLVNEDGDTALICAAREGHDKVIDILLAFHANVSHRNLKGYTALHSTAMCSYGKIVETLLSHGAEVDTQNKHGCSALLSSAQFGHYLVVKTLLQHKANPDIVDADGDTAIMCAAMNSHYSVVQLLLQHNATVLPNHTGYTALHRAAEGDIYEVEDIYEENDAEAEAENCIKTMQLLMEAGINVNAANSDGITPLMQAVSRLRGHLSILEYLIAQGANVNVMDKHGRTCMHYIYSEDALQVLAEYGLDMNKTDFSGQTPLLCIMLGPKRTKKHSRLTGLYHAMISHGADPTIKDNQGLSPPKSLSGGLFATMNEISLDDKANLTVIVYKRSYVERTINLDSCLKVEDGSLVWAHGGNFSASARDIKLVHEGRILQAEVSDGNDGWKQAYIWLDEKIVYDKESLKFLGSL